MADNLVDRVGPQMDLARAASAPAIERVSSSYLALKRGLDVVLAGLVMVLLSPVFLALSLWIRLDSPGPALFRQQRVGRDGDLFTILKFRTMITQAPAYSYKVPIADCRITAVGRVLRRSGLDELPQLWNVLRGDMSLIGPRPELPFIVEQYGGWGHARHSLRPGITGWWQIHHRNEVPMHLNLEYDTYYVRHISPTLDWQIMLTTVRVMVRGLFKTR